MKILLELEDLEKLLFDSKWIPGGFKITKIHRASSVNTAINIYCEIKGVDEE